VFDDKAALERLLGRPIHLFSYPYGDFDAELIGVVRDAGFLGAFTVQPGLVRSGSNRLLLPRYEVTRADGADFGRWLRQIFETVAV
jgi:hypothetical protein